MRLKEGNKGIHDLYSPRDEFVYSVIADYHYQPLQMQTASSTGYKPSLAA